jgi:hypothetical protein
MLDYRLHRTDDSLWEGWFHNGRLQGPVRGIAIAKVR